MRAVQAIAANARGVHACESSGERCCTRMREERVVCCRRVWKDGLRCLGRSYTRDTRHQMLCRAAVICMRCFVHIGTVGIARQIASACRASMLRKCVPPPVPKIKDVPRASRHANRLCAGRRATFFCGYSDRFAVLKQNSEAMEKAGTLYMMPLLIARQRSYSY